MKKIFSVILFLISLSLFGQKTFVNTQVVGTDAVLKRAADTLNPYVPYANRSALTITTDGGIIRFYENGIELRVMAYSPIYETNYYVKTGGDDTKSGLTDEDAWAHHPWMSTWTGSAVLVAGDVVNMKRGDTWSISSPVAPYMTVAQNGTAGKPILTTAYGTGVDPIIKIATASDQQVIYASEKAYIVFDNLHIQHHSGTYNAAIERSGIFLDGETSGPCHDIIVTNCEIDDIPHTGIFGYVDNYNLTIGDITATSCATSTVYSNDIHDFGYAGILLEGVDPATSISDFDVYYNYIHDGTRTVAGDNEYGIAFGCDFSSTAWPVNCIARYNRIENIKTWTALSTHGGSYLYFIDNYVKNSGKSGIAINGTAGLNLLPATCDHLYVERNTIEQTAGGWISGIETAFITHYPATGSSSSDVYIRDNNLFFTAIPATNAYYGISAGSADGLTISGNNIYNGATTSGNPAIYLWFAYGDHGNENVTITSNYINQWPTGINLEGASIIGAVAITDNVITKPAAGICLQFSDNNLSATSDVTVYNNTFTQGAAGSTISVYVYGQTAGGSLIASNNIIGGVTTRSIYYWYLASAMSGTFTCDYNLYWNSADDNRDFYLGGSRRDFTYWKGTGGYDANSPNVTYTLDPLFTNGSATYSIVGDFALGVGSPAINVGTNTGITTDYYGNPRVGNYDIGAIEVQ